MILCEWDAPEGNPGQVAYTCMLSYPIVVSQLSFNVLCLRVSDPDPDLHGSALIELLDTDPDPGGQK
jgi:hypothetical protein